MAFSISASAIKTLYSDNSTVLSSPSLSSSSSSSSSSTTLKLSCSSTLQFPRQIHWNRIGNQRLKSRSRPRILPLVLAKKQTFSSFDDLLENSDKPVLVDFYATWCGPCQFMVPILEQVSAAMTDKIQVVKIDTEKYPTIANKYNIEALPTFIIFKDGKPCDRFEGAFPADQLIQRVEASLKVKQ